MKQPRICLICDQICVIRDKSAIPKGKIKIPPTLGSPAHLTYLRASLKQLIPCSRLWSAHMGCSLAGLKRDEIKHTLWKSEI